jgi:succinate-semialdehyde dehydrogenase/glutarate-semialdehyde dehydrogenase
MPTTLNDAALLRQQMYVGGAWTPADDGSTRAIVDPAARIELVSVAHGGTAETKRAVDAADAAFRPWKRLLPMERAAILKRWHAAVLENVDDLARIITLEQGKPLADARGEVLYGASFFQLYAEEATRIHGDVLSTFHADRRNFVTRDPIGVVAAITPWNFPSVLVARKLAPALAAGCTVILKPAPQTPLSALALAELGARSGVPAGVVNVVTGDEAAIGSVLTWDERVRKISFTGSIPTGIRLLQSSAQTVKKVSLELGGNAPFVVFDDADLDLVIPQAIFSKFRNGGQTCSCTNRFLVQKGIRKRFVEAFVEATRSLRIGPGIEEGIDIGPLIDDRAVSKVEGLVESATRAGARTLLGGRRHALGGSFYEPTVLDDVTPSMAVASQEIFGPVAPIMSFNTEEEAIDLANASEFGLTAYFFTSDPGRLFRFSEALEAGVVGANTAMASNAFVPFGGMKQSGIGREGGRYGIDEYLELKLTCFGGLA